MWHYAERGVAVGPLTTEALRERLAAGTITPATPVTGPGVRAWTPLIRTAAMPPLDDAARLSLCRHCGRRLPPDALIPHGGGAVCGDCKAAYFQALAEGAGAARPAAGDPAGFWVRAGAYLIDRLLLQTILSPVVLIALLIFSLRTAGDGKPDPTLLAWLVAVTGLLGALVPVLYEWRFLLRWGATPGKRLLGLRVIGVEGEPPGSARALGRALARWVTGLSGGLGYLLCLFDEEKRTLHDRLSGTRVVRA